ncbi:DUF6521 family protein [Neisseriaceae bacterium JH1-16]|nr:DUF6521 family protein [Neisseriaceae bacterium JH1-16]
MTIAHDIFIETNPAFCAAVLAKFCDAHIGYNRIKPILPVSYLILPIALSEDLAMTFEKRTKDTGLLVWLERSPKILDNFAKRVNDTLQITTDAVRFGCMSGILELNGDGYLASAGLNISPSILNGANSGAFKRGRLLGNWFAAAGSARAVMEAMGVSV